MTTTDSATYENLLVAVEGRVGIITLNRPKALNALSPALMRELVDLRQERPTRAAGQPCTARRGRRSLDERRGLVRVLRRD